MAANGVRATKLNFFRQVPRWLVCSGRMRGDLGLVAASLAVALGGCSGASTPGSPCGDSRMPATATAPRPGTPGAPGAPPRAKNAPRAHAWDEEARKPRPDLPP